MTNSNWILQLCLAVVAATSIPAMTYGADSPHSRSSIGSIFNEFPGQGGAFQAGRPGEPDPGAKPVTLTRVVEMLDEAGLPATVEGENAAKLELKHNRFTFPIALSVDADRERVRLEMLLTDVTGQALASERLLGLLATNMDFQPMFFTFSDKRKRIELVSSVANAQASAESLRDELSKMAAIAESTANLWEVNAAAAPAVSTPATTTPAPQAVANNQAAPARPAQNQANAASSFVGKWAASRSQTEAFAMQLNNDNTFVLVYVKDGKQSRSTGKFTLGGNQLTLTTSDGGKFSGQVSNVSGRSFDFTPPSTKASKLTFQRAS